MTMSGKPLKNNDPNAVINNIFSEKVNDEMMSRPVDPQTLLQMQKEAIALLTDSELLFISIINKKTGASRILQSRSVINTNRIYDFDSSMKREAAHMYASDQNIFLENVTLKKLNERFRKDKQYTIDVFLRISENSRLRRVSYHFSFNEKYPEYILATTEDITDRYVRDKVTGQLNFNGFKMDCVQEFALYDSEQYAVLNFNMVNFKVVNSMYGYEAGNWLLKKVHIMLSKAAIPFVSVGRENADNFFCLCKKEDYDQDALIKLCKMPISDGNGFSETLELFCGVYFVDNKEQSVSEICDKARIARRLAEREAGVNVYVLDEEKKQRYVDEAVILSAIPKAIENKEIVVYYQPIFDAKSGEMSSAEALVRWQHPQRGLLMPNVFVPAVERTGQIAELDLYVAHQVRIFQKERLSAGKKTVPVSVNVSRYDLLREKYMRYVLTTMRKEPETAKVLRIEITESGMINIPGAGEAFLTELRNLGFQIMIDDFGTGYSSLASVVDRFCDFIKLDMIFARHIGVDRKTEILIKAIIGTAHYLGTKVVAEGVETKAQYEFLRDNGCDYIQGYYFSKPLPQDEFVKLLDEV